MAFKDYKDTIDGARLVPQASRMARDLERAAIQGRVLNQQWERIISGKTDAQIATQLFAASGAAELAQVTDLKQLFTAMEDVDKAFDGDNTVVIPTPNSWYRRMREFS